MDESLSTRSNREILSRRNGVSLSKVSSPYVAVIAGWMVSRLLLSPLRGIVISEFILLPGFVVAVFGVLGFVFHLRKGTLAYRPVFLLAGITLDSLTYWLLRVGAEAPVEVESPWHPVVVAGSLTGLMLILAAVWAARRVGATMASRERCHPGSSHLAMMTAAFLITVIAFRASNVVLQDVPNDIRSLMIAGVEVHHAYQGLLGLTLLQVLIACRVIPIGRSVFVLVGVGAAFVLDQLLYVPLRHCSDAAYFGHVSWGGALLGTALFLTVLLFGRSVFLNREPSREEVDGLLAKMLCHRLRGFAEIEHSPSALWEAARSPAGYLEVDVRASQDGSLFLYHDNHTGPDILPAFRFSSTNAEQVSQARFINRESLLTLDESLAVFASHSQPPQKLCLDIKDYGFEQAYLDAVRSAELDDRVCFVSWIPHSLLRLHELGARSPLILSHVNLTRLGWLGTRLTRLMRHRMLRLGHIVLLGEKTVTAELGKYARGYQHGFLCKELSPDLVSVLAHSGGGICVSKRFICDRLIVWCQEQGLGVWIFSAQSTLEFLRYGRNPGIDVIFSDDAPRVIRFLDGARSRAGEKLETTQ